MRTWIVLCACAAVASGQSINIDINSTTGFGVGVPASTFGAAASQPGTWNAMAAGGGVAPVALVDLVGGGVAATVTRTGAATNFSFNNASTSGDTENLLDDADFPSPGPITYTFANLTPGSYRVYTYAFAPDSAAFFTSVSVTGASSGAQLVGGAIAPANTLTQGITHAVHDVVTSTGTIAVVCTVGTSFMTVNGFQLKKCPTGFGVKVSQASAGANLDIAFTCGNPGHFYILGLSLQQGGFPAGPFFGIEYDQILIDFAILYGPPLFGVLDANGNAFGNVPGPLPSGVQLWAVPVAADQTITVITGGTPLTYTTL